MRSGADERGFSLIEVIVALAILAFVMAATAGLFINALKRTSGQGSRQVAVSLASQAMDSSRAVAVGNLVTGRPQALVQALIASPGPAVTLTDDVISSGNYDPSTTDPTGASAAIPISQTSKVNNVTYNINTFVDMCYRNPSTTLCSRASDPSYTQLWRITVDVYWTTKSSQGGCGSNRCDYVVSSLRDTTSDPVFNNNPGAGLPSPTISTISPTPVSYSTQLITVTGTGFLSTDVVTVPTGGTVTGVTYVNPTMLTFTFTPPPTYPNGTGTLSITNATYGQIVSTTFPINAAPAPTITNVSPSSVTNYVTTTLTLTGTNFQAGATVTIGTQSFTVDPTSTTSATLTYTPSGPSGTQQVKWKNTDTQSSSGYNISVTAAAPPSITSITPNTATPSTPLTLTIVGTNFHTGLVVTASAGTVTSYSFNGTNTITVGYTPSATSGNPVFTVKNTDNQSDTDTIFVGYATPTISSITPTQVNANSTNNSMTISGTNFVSGGSFGVSLVSGGGSISSVTYVNSTTITFKYSAPSSAGTVTVKVTNADGQTVNGTFQVKLLAPTISSISPAQVVTSSSNNSMTITGTNFVSGGSFGVSLVSGGGSISAVTFVNATTATFKYTAPATAGTVTVKLTNNDGQTVNGTFSVKLPAPSISSITPPSVTTSSTGNSMTINGANFSSGGSFGVSVSAGTGSSLTFVSSTKVTFTYAAPSTATTVTVTLTNSDGQTTTGTFQVKLPAPSISSISPGSVVHSSSNTTITINGANFVSGGSFGISVTSGSVTNVTFVSATKVTFKYSAPSSATTVTVTLTNSDGQTTSTTLSVT